MSAVRVLVVDDEAEYTASLSKVLARRGYDVTVASSGEDAVAAAREQRFDAVLLDVKMPGMDGLRTMAEIKRFLPDLRVILMTGHVSPAQEEDGLRGGAFAYVLKPVPVADLVALINRAAGL